ncbi:photosynthetic protein synthase I [Caldimonas brevitalea]|uniref:Photosynthetic protein synthase I n=2 Tax=Caldimonas brevitalea TaxID=413882 RepID=A0A0G3BIL1_9BURK|nr:SCO family protein [Caldimonas brevitalea]AKJ27798.1 photosynthetic protein synthase I [Caldimonas brevitalea]
MTMHPDNLRRRSLLVLGTAAVLPLVVGCDRGGSGGAGGPAADAAKFNNIDISGAEYARDFTLTDHHGQPRRMADFKGKLVAIFFGYTQCPDVCPTSMAELAEVKKALGADGDKLQGLFITVDPERDTPELLKAYMSGFDPSFLALRGTPEQTAAVAKEFKVFFAKVPGKAADSYTMDHTAGVYVFDTAGRIRLFARHGGGPAALAADMKQLLQAPTA